MWVFIQFIFLIICKYNHLSANIAFSCISFLILGNYGFISRINLQTFNASTYLYLISTKHINLP